MQQGLSVSILLFMIYLTTLLTALTIQFAAVVQLTNSVSECPLNEALVTSFEGFFPLWRCDPTRVMASSLLRFLDHTQRRTTVGRTPLYE